jgi:hypothetical protein
MLWFGITPKPEQNLDLEIDLQTRRLCAPTRQILAQLTYYLADTCLLSTSHFAIVFVSDFELLSFMHVGRSED